MNAPRPEVMRQVNLLYEITVPEYDLLRLSEAEETNAPEAEELAGQMMDRIEDEIRSQSSGYDALPTSEQLLGPDDLDQYSFLRAAIEEDLGDAVRARAISRHEAKLTLLCLLDEILGTEGP